MISPSISSLIPPDNSKLGRDELVEAGVAVVAPEIFASVVLVSLVEELFPVSVVPSPVKIPFNKLDKAEASPF